MVIANMALQLETPSFIMPTLLQNGYEPITSQHANASLAGLNLLCAQTRFCLATVYEPITHIYETVDQTTCQSLSRWTEWMTGFGAFLVLGALAAAVPVVLAACLAAENTTPSWEP